MNMNDRIQRFVERHSTDAAPEGTFTPTRTEPDPELGLNIETHEPLASHQESVDLGRHARKCSICHHPDRLAIEQEFVRWRSPSSIAKDHKIHDRASLYSHAHALGLFDIRDRNLRAGLDSFIERAEWVALTPAAVVQAVRIRAHINADGEWVNPPTTHRVVVSAQPASPGSPAAALPQANGESLLKKPNPLGPGLEIDATH